MTFLKCHAIFLKENFDRCNHCYDVIIFLFSDTSYDGKHVLANIEIKMHLIQSTYVNVLYCFITPVIYG